MNTHNQNQGTRLTPRLFYLTLTIIISAYAIFTLHYVTTWALGADEFVFARHIYDYTRYMPYRDFAPYKTVLGYYLLSVPFYFSHASLAPLFYIKDEMIILNGICLLIAGYLANKLFRSSAILLTILAIIANVSFLIYAADLRVDMLTGWCCLFALLALLLQRYLTGGCLLGLAFLISQKAIWYLTAVNGAWLLVWLAFQPETRFTLKRLCQINFSMMITIAIYCTFWSLVSSPDIVFRNLFYDAYVQAGIQWYQSIYFLCWMSVLQISLVFFLFWPVSFISISKEEVGSSLQQRTFIFCLASLFLLQFITYKQAFPYNFVLTVPAFFILYASFFSWLSPLHYRSHQLLLIIFIIGTILYPFANEIPAARQPTGQYQQRMLTLTEQLLDKDSTYLSGVPYFYGKDQTIPGLINLIGPELDYIQQPIASLRPLLLSSLFLQPVSQSDIMRQLETQPVKLILNNYRIQGLPPTIQQYLADHYQQLDGSIYVYAPLIAAGRPVFRLSFSGRYRIQPAHIALMIDGKRVNASDVILATGNHTSQSSIPYRLVFAQDKPRHSITSPTPDKWEHMLKSLIP